VNVRGIDTVGFAGKPVNEFAVPTAARIQVEDLFDIATIEDLGIEAPGLVVRGRMRLFGLEPVQRAFVVERLGEGPRYAFDSDDPRAFGHAVIGCTGSSPAYGSDTSS
jgi:hypothetical protein